MQIEVDTLETLQELISAGELTDPLLYLACIMQGQNPLKVNRLLQLVQTIDERHEEGDDIDYFDWEELREFVTEFFKYEVPTLQESTSAARTLAEYQHSKRKALEGDGAIKEAAPLEPLTIEEIVKFKEQYDDLF